LAYSTQLRPDRSDLEILNKISGLAKQLYTKYTILVAYDTLARNNYINIEQAIEVGKLVNRFRINADNPLLRKINETVSILGLINPEINKFLQTHNADLH